MRLPHPRPHRRELLCAGALGSVGLALPQLLQASADHGKVGKAKSIILILPWGGPGQMDTFDLKPDAPAEIRGEFKPIATNVSGTRICEHLPRLAQMADRYALIRSMSHGIATHNPATHYVLTGHPPVNKAELAAATRKDWPSIGSVLARIRPTERAVPPYVQVPCHLIDQAIYSGGQNAGFFGPAFDPFAVTKDPSRPDFTVPGLALSDGLSGHRLDGRRQLQATLDRQVDLSATVKNMTPYYERAYDLLSSTASKSAFDLAQEPAKLRQRYGMNRHGQSMLLARRLIEAGVRLCMVCDTLEGTNGRWDTHNGNVYIDQKDVLAETDAAVATLLTDLNDRGLLDSTIVAWMGEFGRTPKSNKGGGRDHWPHVYSILLAGGGITGGCVYGASDSRAAYPSENPVAPEDIHATMYHLLGLPEHTQITDALGRPMTLCDGKVVRALVA